MTRAFLALLLAAVACTTAKLTPLRSADARLTADERDLWAEATAQDRRFGQSGVLQGDPALDAYLDSVAQRIATADGLRFRFRVRALKSPYLNAFALPNGSIYVHTGMLVRMENEAQLAAVLAHEMTHATHRHAARAMHDAQNQIGFGIGLNLILPGIGTLAAVAAVSGYSRDLEREADEEGFRLARQAGYDAAAPLALFEAVAADLRDENEKEPFFFATHPSLQARADDYRRLGAGKAGGATRAEEFLAHTRALLEESVMLDLQRGRFKSAGRNANEYAAVHPGTARTAFLFGEIARQRGDGEGAIARYRESIAADASFAPAYRRLGLLLMKRGDKDGARHALTTYLELSPAAADRGYVQRDLETLQ